MSSLIFFLKIHFYCIFKSVSLQRIESKTQDRKWPFTTVLEALIDQMPLSSLSSQNPIGIWEESIS